MARAIVKFGGPHSQGDEASRNCLPCQGSRITLPLVHQECVSAEYCYRNAEHQAKKLINVRGDQRAMVTGLRLRGLSTLDSSGAMFTLVFIFIRFSIRGYRGEQGRGAIHMLCNLCLFVCSGSCPTHGKLSYPREAILPTGSVLSMASIRQFTGCLLQSLCTSRKARHGQRRPGQVRMALTEDGPSVAVVGVTGAVGQEFLSVLSERNFPYSSIKLLASKRSAGKHIEFQGRTYEVEELTEHSFKDIHIALFSAGGSISKHYGPLAAEQGSIVVDNSSAFRMVEDVPLVVPEVNADAMAHISLSNKKGAIIANPNCSTIICLMAATPLHRHSKVKRMVVSTYQAASGAGAAAMAELELQTREVLDGKEPTCNIFSRQYAFNLFSHNSDITPNGYNEEEMKLVKETRKIWNDPDVKVTATCIRVPVMRAHAESINLQFERPLDEETAREILHKAEGVVVIDDRAANNFPTPLGVSSKDAVAVGRIRHDISQGGNYGLDLFVCGDQIRKGAALNAVQIAERLF